MFKELPAVLVAGPPHAGKSVLFYRLTQALRERGIDHYALRACPDGEGNWFHEGNPDLVSTLRVKHSGAWPPTFVPAIGQALENRCLPFLVDLGGRPTPAQECLLHYGTHAILLTRADKPEETQHWQALIAEHDLLPLARLTSQPAGESVITASSPILEGIITGLERSAARSEAGAGPLFDRLLARVSALLIAADTQAWRERNLQRSPTSLTLDVQQALREFTTTSTSWEPGMLPPLLAHLPAQRSLALYGPGPGWLYAALAAHSDPQPFYLFDPKLPFGWITPACVALGADISQTNEIEVATITTHAATILKISFPNDLLTYLQPEPLLFPPPPTAQGLIIDGRVPNWLLTALIRLYKAAGTTWIATFYPPLGKAVVVYAGDGAYRVGELV